MILRGWLLSFIRYDEFGVLRIKMKIEIEWRGMLYRISIKFER